MIYDTHDSPFKQFEKLDFNLDNWLRFWYPTICSFLSISPEDDKKSLKEILNNFQTNFSPDNLLQILQNENVIVVAPGPSLTANISYLINSKINKGQDKQLIISVDGATSFLVKNNIIPTIIVTDLDGSVGDQIFAQKKGSIIIAHIHGDNTRAALRYLPTLINEKIIITTQTRPLKGAYNFLGFSDGDRAVSLLAYFKAKKAKLIGYDFGNVIGKYSKPHKLLQEKYTMKLKKFTIAKSIINWCSKKLEIEKQTK